MLLYRSLRLRNALLAVPPGKCALDRRVQQCYKYAILCYGSSAHMYALINVEYITYILYDIQYDNTGDDNDELLT